MSKHEPVAEIVYFVDPDDGIIREMMHADFEALVDGLIAIPEFANTTQRAVYARIDSKFCIVACVLFRMQFDNEGHTPPQWHLPVDQLCTMAGSGPNLGAGPIKLSTSVQCSVPWHQTKLWDPQEVGDLFYWLKVAAKENTLGVNFNEINDGALEDHDVYGGEDYADDLELDDKGGSQSIFVNQESPFMRDDESQQLPFGNQQGQLQGGQDMGYRGYPPQHQATPMPYGYDPSRYPPGYYPPPMQGQFPGQPASHHPGNHPAHHSSNRPGQYPGHPSQASAPQQQMVAELNNLVAPYQQRERQLQQKVRQLIDKHEQEVQQSKARYDARLMTMSQDYEQSMEVVSSELGRLRMKLEILSSQKDSLEDICAAQKAQIKALGEKIEDLRQRSQDQQRENSEALSKELELDFDRRVRDLEREFEEKLRDKDAEIVYRKEVINQFRKDITSMRRDKIRLVNSGGDKFLEDLDKLGISFIAFHAGVGHISIPLADMSNYMDNPVAYAASRCLVTEEVYSAWLQHHENPVCNFVTKKDGNETCGCKVRKAESPSNFQAGITDRCDKHKSLTSDWENVVNIGS
jgi:uncharacterized coiled-coil protein SlyX